MPASTLRLSLGIVIGALLVLGEAPTAPAQAQQDFPQLRLGVPAKGAISARDPAWAGRGAFKAFRFQGTAGQLVAITVTSKDFDAFATVGRMVNGIFDPLAFDDDGGGGTNARLVYKVPERGTYVVIAQSFERDGAGSFTIVLEEVTVPKPRPPRPIAFDDTVEDVLTEEDAYDEYERRFHTWRFTGQEGDGVIVEMRSRELDSYLILGRMRGEYRFESLAEDDDGGRDLDARLRLTLPETGEYIIRATAMPKHLGRYHLTLRAAQISIPTPLRVGTVEGELTTADGELDDGSPYVDYTYVGIAGERLLITMDADDFDAFLTLGRVVHGHFRPIQSDDDGGGGTNARLEVTLPLNGEFVIRGNSLNRGVGRYTLALRSLGVAP